MKKVSRSILYKEKESIHFFLGEGKTLERDFINKLWERPFWRELKHEADDTLQFFNNACYICTRVFYDDYPPNKLKEYEEIANDGLDDPVWTNHIVPVTMALVVNWLSLEEGQIISRKRGRQEDIEELCRRIRVSIEDRSDLSLEEKEDFQTLIIQEHKLPSGFINDESFLRNSLLEAMEAPSVKLDDIFSSIGHFLDIIKNNPNEWVAATGSDSTLLKEAPKRSFNTEEKLRELREFLNKQFKDDNEQPPIKEIAFNGHTGLPCFTSRQMTILMTAVGKITEKDNPPGKTTLGEVVEKITGYKATTASSNMKGKIPKKDTEAVASAIEGKFPKLAVEVRKLSID